MKLTRDIKRRINNKIKKKKFMKIHIDPRIEHVSDDLYLIDRNAITFADNGFDLNSNQTIAMRKKEELNDYRYFPDPDLCQFHISDAWLDEVKSKMPRLSADYEQLFISEYGLPLYDAQVLASEKEIADYFLAVCEHTSLFKAASSPTGRR